MGSKIVVRAQNNNSTQKIDTVSYDSASFRIIEQRMRNGTVVQAIIKGKDTNYVYNMEDFNVVALRPYGDIEKDKQFMRIRYYVIKTYPYALLAAQKLREYNEELLKIKSKRKRRQLLRHKEQQLKAQFSDLIKKMTVTQGRIFVKLIDRETGQST